MRNVATHRSIPGAPFGGEKLIDVIEQFENRVLPIGLARMKVFDGLLKRFGERVQDNLDGRGRQTSEQTWLDCDEMLFVTI